MNYTNTGKQKGLFPETQCTLFLYYSRSRSVLYTPDYGRLDPIKSHRRQFCDKPESRTDTGFILNAVPTGRLSRLSSTGRLHGNTRDGKMNFRAN